MTEQNMTKSMIIEDVISSNLTGETQANVLDFIAFLRVNEYSVDWDGTWWQVKYQGDCPVLLGINTGGVQFGVLFNHCHFGVDIEADEVLKETAWSHVQICRHHESGGTTCGCDEKPGLVSVFGKALNTCKCPLTFIDPDVHTFANMKKLILLMGNKKMESENMICQSCAMSLENVKLGTNSDGTYNQEHCEHCYKNGKYKWPATTMNGMIKSRIKHSVPHTYPDVETAQNAMNELFPTLKRWAK